MITMSESTAAWMARAMECPDGGIALELFAFSPVSGCKAFCDPNHPAYSATDWEVSTVGDDWRAIVTQVATELHQRTGMPISADGAEAYAPEMRIDHDLTAEVIAFIHDTLEDPSACRCRFLPVDGGRPR
jgi:hypothetical protein